MVYIYLLWLEKVEKWKTEPELPHEHKTKNKYWDEMESLIVA